MFNLFAASLLWEPCVFQLAKWAQSRLIIAEMLDSCFRVIELPNTIMDYIMLLISFNFVLFIYHIFVHGTLVV